ncbi:putative transcriptional regulator of viral defense system [Bradyrhizobium sp. AZCC 2176]
METTPRTLGPAEARVVLSFREQGRDIVEADDIISLLESEKTGRKVIRNLVRKGWLTRLVGGRYMLLPPERGAENIGENNPLAVAAAVVDESYIGWWSAASFHGFTTQKPTTVFVAVRKQMAPRTIEGAEIRFVTASARKFFGFNSYNVYGRGTRISDPEKTLVDCIDRPDLAGGPAELTRIVHAAMAEIDQEKLMTAALQMKTKALLQRLGFLSDLVERPLKDELRQQLRAAIPKKTRSAFGARARREGDIGYVPEWELHVHARKDELLSEVPRIRKKGRTNADDRANP